MDSARAKTETRDSRFDALQAEAAATVGFSANTLSSVRDRYLEAYTKALTQWQMLRDQLTAVDREPRDRPPRDGVGDAEYDAAAGAAEAGAEDARRRTMRGDVDRLTVELGAHQAQLAKLELARTTLERTWLFLQGDDASLVGGEAPLTVADVNMRIMEAQEAERSRLGKEIHDGPAQALSNAIFQVEYIERVMDADLALAHSELRLLRELLRRELGDVRALITQLRPPMLDELGLDGALAEAAENASALLGLAVQTDLAAPGGLLTDGQRTVALRVTQEALQNVRKHAGATKATVATRLDGTDWVLEISDDGRGFDVGAVAAQGRRNFGLQFMRERAELIGARFDVRSRPESGTVVRLAIPEEASTGLKEST